MDPARPVVLILAGLDPSGGAGLVADVATVARRGLHPAAVTTALTVQDSRLCGLVSPVPPELVRQMLEAVIADLPIAAVKIGMLGRAAVAEIVAAAIAPLSGRGVPVVLDPVLRATSGAALVDDPEAALAPLRPLTTLLTPNRDEAIRLGAMAAAEGPDQARAAAALRQRGWGAVLVKGGHFDGDPAIDLLDDGEGPPLRLEGPRRRGPSPHGTGCALSTEIACALAAGEPLRRAVLLGHQRLVERLAAARAIGQGRDFL